MDRVFSPSINEDINFAFQIYNSVLIKYTKIKMIPGYGTVQKVNKNLCHIFFFIRIFRGF